MRIYLAGVSCVGKTTIGKKLASILNITFYDLDHEIEAFFGTSIERLQDRFLTSHSFRYEASKALFNLLTLPDTKECVLALPPSGLMSGYFRAVKKYGGTIVVLTDNPENILKRVVFYDKDSHIISKTLTKSEKKQCLRQIKDDISYFRPSYKKADLHIDITGLNPDNAAIKIKNILLSTKENVPLTEAVLKENGFVQCRR